MTYRDIGHFFIGGIMFSEELLIKIFTDKDTRRVPLVYQSTMIHVIERILDDTDTNECRNKDSNVG